VKSWVSLLQKTRQVFGGLTDERQGKNLRYSMEDCHQRLQCVLYAVALVSDLSENHAAKQRAQQCPDAFRNGANPSDWQNNLQWGGPDCADVVPESPDKD